MMLGTCLAFLLISAISMTAVLAKADPFYPPGSVVRDLDSNAIEKILARKGDDKFLIVYYAPWCGHCQRFAPLFMDTATKYADSGISFAAIDCVAHRDVCHEQQIQSFPTIRGHGFGETIEKDLVEKDVHTIANVESFVTEFQNNFRTPQLRGKRKDEHHPAKRQQEGKPAAVAVLPYVAPPLVLDSNFHPEEHALLAANARWINKTLHATARVTTAPDRLHDALVSLRFLLQMEVLPLLNNPESKQEVMLFLKFVIDLLPEHHQDPFLRYFVYLQNSADAITAKDVDAAAKDAFGDHYGNWLVCGAASKVVSKKTDGLFVRAQDGYLCGLWMLFHYLTVAAEERFILSITEVLSTSTVDTLTVTALDVMRNIHLCVDKFFNCRHCRLHFMDTYAKCEFGRCEIQKSQFDKLQTWLWDFHNFVTHSILHYHLSPENQRDGTENYYKYTVSWPDHDRCTACYDVREASKYTHSTRPANKNIREAYWEPSWKLRSLHDYKPEFAHALLNPFSSSSSSSSSGRRPVLASQVLANNHSTGHESEDTFITLGVVSLVGICVMITMAFFLACRHKNKSSHHYSSAAFRRGRYS